MHKQLQVDSSLAPKPSHVPAELVYEYDYVNDEGLLADPHKRMCELALTTPPVFWSPLYGGHWIARSKATIQEITLNTDLFTSNSDMIPRMGYKPGMIPLSLDPPMHTAYRMPLNRDFSPAGVRIWQDLFTALASGLIDEVAERSGCDFLVDVAEPLPVILFMKIAGMPTDRLAEFRKLAEDATAAPQGELRKAAFIQIQEILSEVIKDRQAEPRDDLISKLISVEVHGRKLTFEELQKYAVLLFLGGLETVVNALSFSIRYLAMHQDLQAELRANPRNLSHAVEELLRLHGIASTIRTATGDFAFNGIEFRKDEQILLHIPAANYDPTEFSNPSEFDMYRKETHITFNTGPHRCLGASLARLELRTFLRLWLDSIPTFRLNPDQSPVFFGGLNLAVRHLPLVW